MNENHLKRLFPHASLQFIAANTDSHTRISTSDKEQDESIIDCKTASDTVDIPDMFKGQMAFFCKTCGAPSYCYPSQKAKYCSLACAYKSKDRVKHMKPKERGYGTCKNCNTIFKIHTNSGAAKFCCQKCAASFIGKSTLARNRVMVPRTKEVTLTCPACSEVFKSWKSSHRVYCSTKCSGKIASVKGSMTKHKNGFYKSQRQYTRGKKRWVEVDGKRFFARSSWEGNYGLYLNFQKKSGLIKDWHHEPDIFWFKGIKRGVCSYLPDFKIVNMDDSIEYHEVKGWMDNKSKTKIKRMAKYHPAIRLIIIEAKRYKEIARSIHGLIPGWVSSSSTTNSHANTKHESDAT